MNISAIWWVHVGSVALSFSLFFLRGLWMWQGTLVQRERWVRIAPHVVDTLLLTSAIAMVVMLSLPVLDTPWLLTKIAALLLYIVLGSVALRRGKTRRIRMTAWLAALVVFGYMVGAAVRHSPLSWLG
jgi:uncharacterized membrane protein SirB2